MVVLPLPALPDRRTGPGARTTAYCAAVELQLQLFSAAIGQLLPERLVHQQALREDVPGAHAHQLFLDAGTEGIGGSISSMTPASARFVRGRHVGERGGGVRRRLVDQLGLQLLEVQELGLGGRIDARRAAGHPIVMDEIPDLQMREERVGGVARGGVRQGEQDAVAVVLAGLERGLAQPRSFFYRVPPLHSPALRRAIRRRRRQGFGRRRRTVA